MTVKQHESILTEHALSIQGVLATIFEKELLMMCMCRRREVVISVKLTLLYLYKSWNLLIYFARNIMKTPDYCKYYKYQDYILIYCTFTIYSNTMFNNLNKKES